MERDLINRSDAEIEEYLRASGFLNAKGGLKNLRLLSSIALRPSLEGVLRSAIDSPSPDNALNNLEGMVKNLPQETLGSLNASPLNLSQLVTVCGSSNYLSGMLSGHPEWLRCLFLDAGLRETKGLDEFKKELLPAVASAPSSEAALEALRVYRNKEFLRLGCRDILRLAGLEEVVAGLSDLASTSLDAASAFAISELKKRFGSPFYTDEDGVQKEAVFAVIGLGKLGGMELNFSSDIDIMYIYSSDKGETSGIEGVPGSRISLHGFFSKAAALITRLISASTEHGFVFRVDLDLRPDGKKGDAANSLRSAEVYYEAWGKPWERGALLKARPVAGDERLGAEFISMITPFVYRKYLDFTAIEEIKSMKEQIDLSLLRTRPDVVDVKLGSGGIREIEFFCQTLQLVHGGKDLSIRERGTLRALDLLRERQYIKDSEAETLKKAYRFLRNTEHRLQLAEGRQTQAIPAKADALERLARMMGFKDSPEATAGQYFWEEYRNVTSSVHEVYRTLFYKKAEEGAESSADALTLLSPETGEDEARARMKALGFKDPASAYKNLCVLLSAQNLTRMTARAQVLLQKLLPLCISRAASCPEPDMALAHLAQFISAVGPRLVFYSLLHENPLIIDELIRIFSASVFLSRRLIEHPENLDILLSRELSVPYKRRKAFFEPFLKEALDTEKDYEERLDSLRRLRNQEVIRIAVNDLRGSLTPRQVSFQLSFLAETCIEAAFVLSSTELGRAYGTVPDAAFVVLGMGKLGGRELIYGSDLDIVFVYSNEGPDGLTTGPKKISGHEFFVKLGQRIISVLSVRTKEGVLFNVDVRLRPSGSSGPLVLSEPMLLNYHMGKTMVWERQALIKARSVAGDMGLGKKVLNKLAESIYSKALQQDDVREMLRIRGRMEGEIAKEDSSRYNIKTGKGGLVDIEFLAQALQMRYGLDKNGLRTQDTLKALKRLNKAALLPEDDYKTLKDAYLFYRLLEMKLRVVHDRPEGVINAGSPELNALARRAGDSEADSGDRLLKRYRDVREAVRGIYLNTMEGFLRQGRP